MDLPFGFIVIYKYLVACAGVNTEHINHLQQRHHTHYRDRLNVHILMR